MLDLDRVWLEKAQENLEAAEGEYANRRYNSCANRAYYACFQAAIYALIAAGIRARDPRGAWGHDFVQAEFNGRLIGRQKRYPAELRATLNENYGLRETADYSTNMVTEVKARRSLARAREFVAIVGRMAHSDPRT